MLGPATDMPAPESGSTCTIVDPLGVEISARMVGAVGLGRFAGVDPANSALWCLAASCAAFRESCVEGEL